MTDTNREYDMSQGSSNPYTVTTQRHGLPRPCLHCGRGSTVTLDGAAYFAYAQRGQHVQVAFPTLTVDERDLLSVGIHPECSEAFYGPEPD